MVGRWRHSESLTRTWGQRHVIISAHTHRMSRTSTNPKSTASTHTTCLCVTRLLSLLVNVVYSALLCVCTGIQPNYYTAVEWIVAPITKLLAYVHCFPPPFFAGMLMHNLTLNSVLYCKPSCKAYFIKKKYKTCLLSVPLDFTEDQRVSSSCNKTFDNGPKATEFLCKKFLSAAAYLLSHLS